MTKSELLKLKASLENDILKNNLSIDRSKRSIEQSKALIKYHKAELNEVYAGLIVDAIKNVFRRKS